MKPQVVRMQPQEIRPYHGINGLYVISRTLGYTPRISPRYVFSAQSSVYRPPIMPCLPCLIILLDAAPWSCASDSSAPYLTWVHSPSVSQDLKRRYPRPEGKNLPELQRSGRNVGLQSKIGEVFSVFNCVFGENVYPRSDTKSATVIAHLIDGDTCCAG